VRERELIDDLRQGSSEPCLIYNEMEAALEFAIMKSTWAC
jgi:hypothetical protein